MTQTNIDNITITDVLEIERVLYRGLRCADEKLWEEWLNYFTDEQTIDFGGVKPPQTINSEDLANWARLAYASVKTQHMMFNLDIQVDGDRAKSTSCGHARHQRTDTGDFWHIYPRYEHEYTRTSDGWKVSRIKMTPIFEEGNPKLLEESHAAASKSSAT